ncbi:MAG: EAL domain-containing protein [Rhodoferax sp.]|nr:EAL domain-containing protein [Rhodoferax sp.]
MRLDVNESNIPRLHLAGTIAIIVVLTVTLGAFFSWRSIVNHRVSLERISQSVVAHNNVRLAAEMASVLDYIAFARTRTDHVLRASLTSQVDTAMQIVEAIYARESPRKPEHEVKQLMIEALRPVRFFEGRGYYFIDDMQGKFILLPTAPQLEGKTLLNNKDDTGHYIMRGLIEAATKPQGEGFSSYRWYSPGDTKKMSDKLAYVRHFAPFDWLIGTGDYTAEWEDRQKAEALSRLRSVRFGTSGYLAVMDRDGRALISPSNVALEGVQPGDLPATEQEALQKMQQLGSQGGGYLRYDSVDPVSVQRISKTALVRQTEPWGWLLAITTTDAEQGAALQQEITRFGSTSREAFLDVLLALAAALTVGALASWGFSSWSGQLFQRYHQQIAEHATALQLSEQRFRTLTEWSPEAILVHRSGQVIYVNPAAVALFGASQADQLLGKATIQLVHPDDWESLATRMRSLIDGTPQLPSTQSRFVRLDGTAFDVRVQGTSVIYDGTPAIHVSIHDITEQKQAEEALRIAATAFEAQQAMVVTNAQRMILRVNQAFTSITGYSAGEALGQYPEMLSSGRHDQTFYATLANALDQAGAWAGEIWNRRKNGEVYPEWLSISAVKDDAGLTTHFVAIFSDISERKSDQEQIETLAFYDPLTRLPNRRLLLDRLEQALHAATRHKRKSALLFVDLDNFKTLNDTLGHHQGDLLLSQVAQRLRACIREGDTVARLGSDEFVVMLEDLSENQQEAANQAEAVGEKILAALAQDYPLDSGIHHSTTSIGVTLFGGETVERNEEPLKRAELAMFQAKLAGRNSLRFFDTQMQAQVSAHAALEADLRETLSRQGFLLHYQPQVVGAGRMTGVEALLRWPHPQRGMVSPAQFIPLAEETGLILPIGQWVLDTACAQLAVWAADPALAHLTMAVNVSARQFRQPDFVDSVLATLARTGATPKLLKLELTESMLVDDVEAIIAKMSALKNQGVGFSLDDFGTGYSSLSYLKRLPLDQLKIDQGFVRNIVTDANDAAIAKMVVVLAESLGLSVIAEGVELQAQADFLAHLGCHAYQGYRFSRPLDADALQAFAKHSG